MKRFTLRARVFIGSLIITLLAGCEGLIPPLPTPAAPASVPSAPVSPATATDLPTETPAPPTATLAPPVTPEFTVTPGPSPTSDPIDLVMIGQDYRLHALQLSPDGAKRAEVVIYNCIATGDNPDDRQSFEFLRVVYLDNGVEVQLDNQFISCGGLGAYGLDILGWSADSRFLLYTPHRAGQPDGGCRPWARSVVLADTVELALTPLDQAAASPDGTKLAGWQGRELVVIAPESGELGRAAAPLPQEGLHPPVWSPDGARLAYLLTSTFCPAAAGDSAVVVVDAATMQPTVAAVLGAPEFASVEWIDASRLRLIGADGSRWEADLTTGGVFQSP